MIHKLNIPDRVVQPLLRSSSVQLAVLRYAATVGTFIEPDLMTGLKPAYGNDADGIAAWVFARKERKVSLLEFAAAANGAPAVQQWLQQLEAELTQFSAARPTGLIKPFSEYDKAGYPWAESARTYLESGYDALRDASLPKAVAGIAVRGYDFIREFRRRNRRVLMCPACDGSRQIDGREPKRPFTSLDHFLPQQSYPHLALHPRNLVPVCSACNTLKGSKDPLDKKPRRRDLSDITLPYDCDGWKEASYADVSITGLKTAGFNQIFVTQNAVPLTESITVHLELFDVVNRWNARSDDVGFRLFRRLRQYFMGMDIEYRGAVDVPDLQKRLDRLLAFVYEDVGSEPDAYAVTWWLATLIKTEVTQGGRTAAASPLVREIKRWLEINQEHHSKFSARGEQVRQRLP